MAAPLAPTGTPVPSDDDIAVRADAALASIEQLAEIAFAGETRRQIAALLIQMALVQVRRDASIAAMQDTHALLDAAFAALCAPQEAA